MLSGRLRSALIILITTALNFSTAQAQVDPSSRTPARGILTERLSPGQLELWRKIERIVFAVDVKRQVLHPVLHALWERVEMSGHTIYLEIRENLLSNIAGLCRLEKFDPTGQHHIAVIELNPRAIDRAYVSPDVRRSDGLIPFKGLGKVERYAEVLGHELAHAAEILLNQELARQFEELVEPINELLLSPRMRRNRTFLAGAEIKQRIEKRDSLLQRLETYAEIMETLVWRELRARRGPNKTRIEGGRSLHRAPDKSNDFSDHVF